MSVAGRRRSLGAGAVEEEEGEGGYRPVAYRTEGVRLACLVNASVTVCGESIIAFGGFDQYTDEVFNHVLRLDLNSYTWTLVDNYGDIPSVRMGMCLRPIGCASMAPFPLSLAM